MDIRYLNGYKFVCHDKHYPKEACDVRTHYSTLFPFSSMQNCRSNGYTRGHSSSNPCAARQAFSTHMPWMRAEGFRCPQLDPAQNSGSESGHSPVVGHLQISKSVLRSLSRHPYRRFGVLSPVSSGDNSIGSLCLSAMPVDDRLRCGSASGTGLENSQSHRQILSGTRSRTTRLPRLAHLGRGRNLDPKRPPVSDHCSGLSHRPSALCRQRSKGQNAGTVFQSVEA
jgi:hypothetical protein